MKKMFFIAAFAALMGTGAIFAQSLNAIEEQVDNAVHELGALTPGQMQVVIEPVTLEGTQTTSRLSALLFNNIKSYAINRSGNKFRIIEKSRAIPQGVIEGVYAEYGDDIRVTLTLHQNTPQEKTLGSTAFTISIADLQKAKIAWLPENTATQQEVITQNKTIETAAQQVLVQAISQSTSAATPVSASFTIDAWPDHEDGTYIGGEEMKIKLWADKDCYFKVYCLDADNNFSLLYPNQKNKDNRLKANQLRTIPENPIHFTMSAPYGQENILIYASDKPFEIKESELTPIKGSASSIGATIERGIELTEGPEKSFLGIKFGGPSGNRLLVEKTFQYTVNPPLSAEETITFQKPADMKEVVQSFKTEVKNDGGTFTGSESQGSLSIDGLELTYKIQGDAIVVTVRYSLEKNYTKTTTTSAPSRGAGGGYAFTMNKPANMGAAIQKARTEIEKKNGVFIGNETGGEFWVKALGAKLSGKYAVGGNITVTIEEKPGFLGEKTIESQVKQTFGAF
jgi:hypothetical protein